MKKNLAKKITLSILAGAVLMSSSVVWAATVTTPPTNGTEWEENLSPNIWHTRGVEIELNAGTDKDFASAFNSNGDATGGKVTISGGEFNADYQQIYGGYSGSGDVGGETADKGNKVTISGGEFEKTIVYGGRSTTGAAEHNEVVISDVDDGSTFDAIYGGKSDSGAGNAEGNRVTLSAEDATYESSIYGGYSYSGDAKGNTVTISDGTFNGTLVYGGYSYSSNATGNTVNISGGTFTNEVCGGRSTNGDVTGNTVNISGGTFTGSVYGGYSFDGNATGNTVNISVDANLENASLYGGYGHDSVVGEFVVKYGGADTPNTLNIGVEGTNSAGTAWNPTSRKLQSIKGFDVINIYGVKWNEAEPHIKVDDIELKDTKINAYVSGEQTDVSSKEMTLIDATTLTMANGATNYLHNDSKVTLYADVASVYTGIVEVDETNKDVVIKLEEKSNSTPGGTGGAPTPERNDQVLVLGESRAAAVAFTNQGSELIETGLDALARDNSKDTKVFAAIYGNHSEYETGSHVNVNGWSGIVGIGKTNADGLTVGAFFENGEGNYSTHNIFTADYIRGDGEACYNGGGFLVRKDNANGVYAEASLRAGNLQNELRNAVRNGADLTGYDVDTFYYGAHIGIGKVIPRGADGDSLDVYGKFIYTHHDGETFDVGGTPTKFDSVESERLRLGFRLNEVQTNKLSMYYGAAWEYEFNGDAHDKIASFDLSTPSLEGSTVIGEIGMHYKASEKWSLDLNARAYTGQREGFSGSVQANYSF